MNFGNGVLWLFFYIACVRKKLPPAASLHVMLQEENFY